MIFKLEKIRRESKNVFSKLFKICQINITTKFKNKKTSFSMMSRRLITLSCSMNSTPNAAETSKWADATRRSGHSAWITKSSFNAFFICAKNITLNFENVSGKKGDLSIYLFICERFSFEILRF